MFQSFTHSLPMLPRLASLSRALPGKVRPISTRTVFNNLPTSTKAFNFTSSPKFEGSRSFSGDSHPDFAPKRKVADVNNSSIPVQERIAAAVAADPVVLFMKGVPEAPQCGFSLMVVRILNHYGVDFQSYNVLEDEDLREGIKTYSDWPTIPQLYVKGEFVGGCDIVREMHEEGELPEALGLSES